jgi:hypothetical protein
MKIAFLRSPRLLFAILPAALLSLAFSAPSFSQASSKVIGIAAALVNDVSIKPAALSSYSRAKLRQRIALRDQVRTGANSRLQIALLDKTKVSVGSNAQLTIDKFIYDPSGGSLSVTAAKGALRFISGSTKSTRTVNTPSATIGIRGTIFDLAVGGLAVEIAQRERAVPQGTQHDPDTASLAVLRGPGPNRQSKELPGAIDVAGGGQTVALETPLQAAYVPYAGATPIGPFAISLPGLDLLNDMIVPPPPEPDYTEAAHPVPDRTLREPPDWADPRFMPPGGAGPEPGVPGGFGAGLPNPGAFPVPPARQPGANMPQPGRDGGGMQGAGNTPPPARTPQTAPTTTAQPAGVTPNPNNQQPSRMQPNNPNSPAAGTPSGPNDPIR